jgi:hypothetical protein
LRYQEIFLFLRLADFRIKRKIKEIRKTRTLVNGFKSVSKLNDLVKARARLITSLTNARVKLNELCSRALEKLLHSTPENKKAGIRRFRYKALSQPQYYRAWRRDSS